MSSRLRAWRGQRLVSHPVATNVSLTPELQTLVNAKLRSGVYHSANEVIREGLRLLEEQDRPYQVRLEALRREVRKGLAQLDRGQGRPLNVHALKKGLRKEVARKAST